ncbi:MAG: radical SAM protein [Patescibacteria group bacterium]|nr:radical SAM protein [Patescibacteria group bacterium]
MKILLVEPGLSEFDVMEGIVGQVEPLGLETVAAGVTANHEVRIVDLKIEPEALEPCLESFAPDVVAVGSVSANLHLAKDVLHRAKAFDARIRTVIGGHHVSFLPSDASDRYIDVVVMGEADDSFREVVEALEGHRDLRDVRGIAINCDSRQHLTPERPEMVDIERLPWPARHLVAGYRGRYFQRGYPSTATICTSRGCTNRCRFCTRWRMAKGTYRMRSAQSVAAEVAQLPDDLVDFIDDNAVADVPRIMDLCELLARTGVRKHFKMYGRADTIVRHPEMVSDLVGIGLKFMLVGFESVDQVRLEGYSKGIRLSDNNSAIGILRDQGVRIIGYFVVAPDFDEADFDRLGDYVERNGITDPVFTILTPLPGSLFYEDVRAQLARPGDYRTLDFFHPVLPTKLPLDLFYDRFIGLYRRAYPLDGRLPPGTPESVLVAVREATAKMYERLELLKTHGF